MQTAHVLNGYKRGVVSLPKHNHSKPLLKPPADCKPHPILHPLKTFADCKP